MGTLAAAISAFLACFLSWAGESFFVGAFAFLAARGLFLAMVICFVPPKFQIILPESGQQPGQQRENSTLLSCRPTAKWRRYSDVALYDLSDLQETLSKA